METLEHAIYATLAYADIFEYPLSVPEIYRYLAGWTSTPRAIACELEQSAFLREHIIHSVEYYTLRGRESSFALRQQRAEISSRMWPKALHYGSWMAALPFIRMVAVTGSLAVDNAASGADMDFLIVTQNGRLWTARSLIILLVRLAARWGDVLCPNYFVSEDHLIFPDRSLYTAHEIIQMVPIAGFAVYERLMAVNDWTQEYLPNARPRHPRATRKWRNFQGIQQSMERILQLPLANRFEHWEMNRKVQRFTAATLRHPEACFRPDLCKGHVDDHRVRIQAAFKDKLMAFEEMTL